MQSLNIITSSDLRRFHKQGAIISRFLELTFITWFDKRERPHRHNGPAEIITTHLGVIRSQRWFINGELHRTDGPAVILTSTSGSLESEAWFIRNERDRGGKYPVFIDYDTKGKPRTIGYREEADDMLPYFTVRFFFPDGSLKAEAWGVEKIFARNHSVDERDLHRLSGPAYITYDENGNITDAIWRRHGEVDEDYFTEHKIMSWQMKMRKQQVLLTQPFGRHRG